MDIFIELRLVHIELIRNRWNVTAKAKAMATAMVTKEEKKASKKQQQQIRINSFERKMWRWIMVFFLTFGLHIT